MKKKTNKEPDESMLKGLTPERRKAILRELGMGSSHEMEGINDKKYPALPDFYNRHDFNMLPGYSLPSVNPLVNLKTLDELLEQDKQREKDGFPRRIRIGKLVKPMKDNNGQIIIVPSTTEPKFYHDDSITEEEEDATGGSGEGEEGEVIGEQQAQPQQGQGQGQGAGQGDEASHDITQDAFDLGKIITEKFELPNLKEKGKKRSTNKYTYDLTDKNRGFGQLLDMKATLRKIIETNILLGNLKEGEEVHPEKFLINPDDHVYRILSKEKDFETQAVVFFVRDYSGSMQGKPTEVVTTQHLFIYSWLAYQYKNNVQTRFILHDTSAKEVEDFYTYYRSTVAGGTKIAPAFQLVNKIVEEEQLARENNIYVFHGTDGDDWDEDGKEMIEALRKMLTYSNRVGITVAKNAYTGSSPTTVENYIEKSGLSKEKPDLFRIDSLNAENTPESRIIDGIKKLIG